MYRRVANVVRVAAPRLSAAYSSKPAPRTTASTSFQELSKIIEEAGEKQPEIEVPASSLQVKLLRSGRAIQPSTLAYDTRVVNHSAPRTKRLAVAPASKQARAGDMFYQLGIDPLSVATNPSILSGYLTEMGQIKPRTQTGLTVKTQRRLGKAIRRARMMGVIPMLSKPRKEDY